MGDFLRLNSWIRVLVDINSILDPLYRIYQNMEKKDEEHEEQGVNEALTEARPSESAELKNRVHG